MWLTTTRGFYSIVAHRDAPDMVLVRGRKRAHLEALQELCEYPLPDVSVDPKADYPFRMTVPKAVIARLAYEFVMDIDYPNFKTAAAKRDRQATDVYHSVWSTLLKLEATETIPQRRNPYAWTPAEGPLPFDEDDWGDVDFDFYDDETGIFIEHEHRPAPKTKKVKNKKAKQAKRAAKRASRLPIRARR